MRKIVAPLALLASVSLLTSCTKTEEAPVVVPPTTETPAPVMEDVAPPAPTELPVPTAPEAPVTPPAPPEAAAPISRTETVSYKNPAGDDSVEFSVTVENGIITSAVATPKAEHDISKKRQEAFAAALSESVVGKNAKELDVTAIGGSSLTTAAFKMFVQSF